MAKAVLVAGGAGYIGSHVCKVLATAGYLPVTLDNLCKGHRELVQFGPLVESEISDRDAVRGAIKKHEITAVIDLAGFIEVGESVIDPIKYYKNNFVENRTFLEIVKACGIRAFVFSSTAAVYGEPETTPIPETHALRPKNPYGWSKLMFEEALRDSQVPFMALRYFNATGASPDGDIGECHEPESHLIPRACLAALGKTPAIEIFGQDYPTKDGTAVRDYVHVMDLANAHVLAIEALLGGGASAAYNLGLGNGFSVKEVLASFESLGHKVPHKFAPRRAGDPTVLVADSSAAKKALGWKPTYTDLKTIIETSYRWHTKN